MSLPVEKHKEDRTNRVGVLDRRKVGHLLQQNITHQSGGLLIERLVHALDHEVPHRENGKHAEYGDE